MRVIDRQIRGEVLIHQLLLFWQMQSIVIKLFSSVTVYNRRCNCVYGCIFFLKIFNERRRRWRDRSKMLQKRDIKMSASSSPKRWFTQRKLSTSCTPLKLKWTPCCSVWRISCVSVVFILRSNNVLCKFTKFIKWTKTYGTYRSMNTLPLIHFPRTLVILEFNWLQ